MPVFEALQGFCALPQGKPGLERRDLLQEALNQLPCEHAGVAGNIIDGLFGVNLRELATGLPQGIYQMAAHFEQAGLEYSEQADGPCPYDQQIRFNN